MLVARPSATGSSIKLTKTTGTDDVSSWIERGAHHDDAGDSVKLRTKAQSCLAVRERGISDSKLVIPAFDVPQFGQPRAHGGD